MLVLGALARPVGEVLGVACSVLGLDQEEAVVGSFMGPGVLAVGIEFLWAELPGQLKLLFPVAGGAMGLE